MHDLDNFIISAMPNAILRLSGISLKKNHCEIFVNLNFLIILKYSSIDRCLCIHVQRTCPNTHLQLSFYSNHTIVAKKMKWQWICRLWPNVPFDRCRTLSIGWLPKSGASLRKMDIMMTNKTYMTWCEWLVYSRSISIYVLITIWRNIVIKQTLGSQYLGRQSQSSWHFKFKRVEYVSFWMQCAWHEGLRLLRSQDYF